MEGTLLIFIILFILGTVFGSFGGVLLERGQAEGFARHLRPKILGGRSYCPGCKKSLQPRQLIPLLGRLLQRGKCVTCKQPIPTRYCRFEMLMGVVFVGTGWLVIGSDVLMFFSVAGAGRALLFRLGTARALTCLIVADLFRNELNVYIRIFLLLRTIGFQFFGIVGDFDIAFWGAIVLTGLFALIYQGAKRYATRKTGTPTEGFGEGDVMMAMIIGLLSSFVMMRLVRRDRIVAVQLTFLYVILSSVLGLVFRGLRAVFVKTVESSMPFVPAMIVGWLVMVRLGEWIVGVLS